MFSENFSSILWFSGCLLGLILVGILISGVSRKQIGVFEGNSALVEEIKDDESIAKSLQLELLILGERLESRTKRADNSTSGFIAERSNQATLRNQVKLLEEERSSLKTQIPEISSEFAQFKKTNLSAVWRKAAGESIGRLYLKSGRLLEGVVIIRVTHDGLEVRHSGGATKLAAKELPNSYQARFQWDLD